MKLLWRVTRLDVTRTLTYRGAFFLLMLATMTMPIVSLLVWLTVASHGVKLPYTREQFITYFVLLSLVITLTGAWAGQYLAADIRNGKLSPVLLRPWAPVIDTIGNNLGEKIVKLPLLAPLLVVAIVAFKGFHLPQNKLLWVAFVPALLLGMVVMFAVDYGLGLLAFWLDDVDGIIRLRWLVSGVLSGSVVPLALLPKSWLPFMEAQPFRSTVSFPLELITRSLTPADIAKGFAYQFGWSVVLLVACRTLWRRGLRAYSAVGA